MNDKAIKVIKKLNESGIKDGKSLAAFDLESFMKSELKTKDEMQIVTELQAANKKDLFEYLSKDVVKNRGE